jgi:hypothetical protein
VKYLGIRRLRFRIAYGMNIDRQCSQESVTRPTN